jgi:hypothetical protein
LPDYLDEYWRGQKRKVFRNKLASARRCGITWRQLRSDEIAGAVQTICDGRGWKRVVRPEIEVLLGVPLESAFAAAACSPEGQVISVSVAVASGDVAQVRWGLSVARGSARWAAFAGLVEAAHAFGYRKILVGPMVSVDSEDEYFQRRVGFLPSNIVVA